MTTGALARSLLEAAAAGGPVRREDANEVARAWLAATGGDLAVRVLTGDDEHLVRHVVELAELVLAHAIEADDEQAAGGAS